VCELPVLTGQGWMWDANQKVRCEFWPSCLHGCSKVSEVDWGERHDESLTAAHARQLCLSEYWVPEAGARQAKSWPASCLQFCTLAVWSTCVNCHGASDSNE